MFQKFHIFIGSLFFLFFGLFSANSFAGSYFWNTCISFSTTPSKCYVAAPSSSCFIAGDPTTAFYSSGSGYGNCTFTGSTTPYGAIGYTDNIDPAVPPAPPCPAAGTPYTGYYPAQGAATNTVYAPNGTSATCAVNIDNTKTSCPPNTLMPTFGTVETPACIVTGVYSGSAGPSGAQANAVSAPSSSADCPTGTGTYSITNGTSTISGCAPTSKATSSNPSATPASTTSTGPNTTNTTETTTNTNTTTNPDGSTTTHTTETQQNPSACGGAGQPACNVNSTCGGAGQPACNTNIGDSTFTVATPTMTAPIFTDNTQGNVSTNTFSISNFISSGSTSCPAVDMSGTVLGQSYTLPFSQMCVYMDWIKYIVIVAAVIASMKLL
jgi:hypothetical protein